MGEFAIITFGGGEVLWKVYNALALVFQSNSLYVTSVFKLALGLGAILAAVRAILGQNFWLFAQRWFVPSALLLALFFVPKTRVHIVDQVDRSFHYAAVDHVPLGAALMPAVASQISAFLVRTFETAFATPEVSRMSVTGGMFAARLADSARSLRITDPVTRENIKNFLDRALIWPFLYGNVQGLGKEARTTPHLLSFLKAHPHPSNGVYWREKDGSTHFKTCRECLPLVEEALREESEGALTRLARQLFPSTAQGADEAALSGLLRRYLSPGFEALGALVGEAHAAVGQHLLLNATRDAMDDGREASGLTRKWDTLVGLQGGRALQTQGIMELIRGNTAGTWLPTLHSLFFALLLLLFVLLAPLCFLPGGFEMLRMWVQLMLWVQLWPVFSSILYCLGDLYGRKAGLSLLTPASGALNFATQHALGDAAQTAYCWLQGMQLSVPFLSWAFLNRSAFAISNLASSLSQPLDAGASRAASETVDGNFSFDNQSFRNRSAAMVQYGRQELGPHLNFGQSIDTGSLLKTFDPVLGETVYQEHLSSLKTAFSGEESLCADLSQAATQAHSIAQSDEQNYGESLSNLHQKTQAFLESVASGKLVNENWTMEEGKHFVQSAQTALHDAKTFQEDSAMTDSRQLQMSLGIAGHGMGLSAQTQKTAQKMESFARNEQYQEDTAVLLQSAHHEGWSSQTNQDAQRLQEYRQSLDNAQSWAKTHQASSTRSHNLETAARLSETRGLSLRTDLTDAVLEHVAHKAFGGNRDAAVQLASRNPDAFKAHAAGYIAERKAGLVDRIAASSQLLSEKELQKTFSEWSQSASFRKDALTQSFQRQETPKHSQEGSDAHQAFQKASQKMQAPLEKQVRRDEKLETSQKIVSDKKKDLESQEGKRTEAMALKQGRLLASRLLEEHLEAGRDAVKGGLKEAKVAVQEALKNQRPVDPFCDTL